MIQACTNIDTRIGFIASKGKHCWSDWNEYIQHIVHLKYSTKQERFLQWLKLCLPPFVRIITWVLELFLYSYEADFIHRLLKKNEKKLARSFNFTFRYIDGVLSLNNSRFGDFVDR